MFHSYRFIPCSNEIKLSRGQEYNFSPFSHETVPRKSETPILYQIMHYSSALHFKLEEKLKIVQQREDQSKP